MGEAGADPSSHQQQLPSAGEEGDEGSCELSDEVSRDSTMGSDSDTFSSPFCLSPVSEALCESSGSVFLDSESRSVRGGLKWDSSRSFYLFFMQQSQVYFLFCHSLLGKISQQKILLYIYKIMTSPLSTHSIHCCPTYHQRLGCFGHPSSPIVNLLTV